MFCLDFVCSYKLHLARRSFTTRIFSRVVAHARSTCTRQIVLLISGPIVSSTLTNGWVMNDMFHFQRVNEPFVVFSRALLHIVVFSPLFRFLRFSAFHNSKVNVCRRPITRRPTHHHHNPSCAWSLNAIICRFAPFAAQRVQYLKAAALPLVHLISILSSRTQHAHAAPSSFDWFPFVKKNEQPFRRNINLCVM